MKLRITLFILSFITIHIGTFAQTKQQIDSLLLQTHYLNQKEGNISGAIDIAFEAVKRSEKIDYEYGMETGLYTIAVLLSDSREFEKSIDYIEKAKLHSDFLNKNPGSLFNLLILQASNNYELGFSSLAASCFHKAASVILNAEEFKNKKYYEMLLYMRSGLAYDNRDSQYVRYLKAKEIILHADRNFSEDFPQTERLAKQAELYDQIGTIHLDKGRLDSAKYYYIEMAKVAKELQSNFIEALALARLGTLYEEEGNYNEALNLLTKAELLLQNSAIFSNLKKIYDVKYRLYGKLNQADKEKEYLSLSKQLTDSLNSVKNKGRDRMLVSLVNEKEAEMSRLHTERNYMIVLYFCLSLFGVFCSYFIFSKYRKNRERRLDEQQHLLEQINEELDKVKEESEYLQQTVQNSKEGILVLARENHPDFWPHFRELYPTFRENLLMVNPELKVSELIFCAYIYLGFSTKEIAEYTFKAMKTIENKRYHLRKRLGLTPETDLAAFISDIVS